MRCAPVTWSSPLQRGVQEASPMPVSPASVWTFTRRNGETVCAPPRPLRMANSRLSGTLMGIVSRRVIFTELRFLTADDTHGAPEGEEDDSVGEFELFDFGPG